MNEILISTLVVYAIWKGKSGIKVSKRLRASLEKIPKAQDLYEDAFWKHYNTPGLKKGWMWGENVGAVAQYAVWWCLDSWGYAVMTIKCFLCQGLQSSTEIGEFTGDLKLHFLSGEFCAAALYCSTGSHPVIRSIVFLCATAFCSIEHHRMWCSAWLSQQ